MIRSTGTRMRPVKKWRSAIPAITAAEVTGCDARQTRATGIPIAVRVATRKWMVSANPSPVEEPNACWIPKR